jgi:hypothetical protein
MRPLRRWRFRTARDRIRHAVALGACESVRLEWKQRSCDRVGCDERRIRVGRTVTDRPRKSRGQRSPRPLRAFAALTVTWRESCFEREMVQIQPLWTVPSVGSRGASVRRWPKRHVGDRLIDVRTGLCRLDSDGVRRGITTLALQPSRVGCESVRQRPNHFAKAQQRNCRQPLTVANVGITAWASIP